MTDVDPTVFEEAATLLETSGWTRGDYCRNGRHCAMGAIGVVLGQRGGFRPFVKTEDGYIQSRELAAPLQPYVQALSDTLGIDTPWEVPEWNDSPSRKRSQVVRVMRRTAEELRS